MTPDTDTAWITAPDDTPPTSPHDPYTSRLLTDLLHTAGLHPHDPEPDDEDQGPWCAAGRP